MRRPIDQTIRSLVIRGLNWRLGDSLMTTPYIRAVRRLFPKAAVALIIPPRVARVFEGSPDINEILLYDTQTTHRSIASRIAFALALRKRNFDAAFLLQRAFEAAFIMRIAGIPVRLGYDSDGRGFLLTHRVAEERWSPASATCHQIEYNMKMLAAYFTLPDDTALSIYPLPRDRSSLTAKLAGSCIDIDRDDYLVLGPGTSYGVARLWDRERWRALIGRLAAERPALKYVIIGAEHDAGWTSLTDVPNTVNLVGKTDIGELISLMQTSRCVVTIDNGNTHLACALSKPLVALFGTANPLITGPYRRIEDVIYKKPYCSPCWDTICREGHHSCMRDITVDEVFAKVMARIR